MRERWLIAHWKTIWWRRWSTWLAGLNAFCVTYLFSQPIILLGLIGFIPSVKVQICIALAIGFLAFALPVLVSLLAQPKLQEKVEEKVMEKELVDATANYKYPGG